MITVLAGNNQALHFLDNFAKVRIAELGGLYSVSAYPINKDQNPSTLAEYHHLETAQHEFDELVNAIEAGKDFYRMARTLYDAEQIMVHDARVKRRGGS